MSTTSPTSLVAHAHPHNVMNRRLHLGKGFQGSLAHHAPIGYHADLPHPELRPHAFDHGQETLGVGGVARPHFATQGTPAHIEGDANNHLGQVGPVVFAIAVLADTLPASSLEINGGRIKEHQAHFAKEIALALKEGFFDHILGATRAAQHPLPDLFSQPRHSPVEMLEGQVLGSWNSITLSPALGGPVAARSEKPVQHGEINSSTACPGGRARLADPVWLCR